MEQIEKAERYLKDIDWPESLGVRCKIYRDEIVISLRRFDWIMLPEEQVVKTSDLINRTMTWLNFNGYPARLEVLE